MQAFNWNANCEKLNLVRYLVILIQCLVSILSRGLVVIKTFEDLLHVSLPKKIADDNRKRKEIRNKLWSEQKTANLWN